MQFVARPQDKGNADSRLKASLTKFHGIIFLSALCQRTVTIDLKFTSLAEADYLTVHLHHQATCRVVHR